MAAEPTIALADAHADTPAKAACAHCGLPVPAALLTPAQAEQFCCSGCRAVYQIIHGCGLEAYYRLRAGERVPAVAARTTDREYEEFDNPTFERLYVHSAGSNLKAADLFLEGVHCNACVWLVEKLPRVVPHVVEARLDYRRAVVRITWDSARGALSAAAAALDRLGYPAHPARDANARALRQREDRELLVRIGVAGAVAGNVMMLAFALYGGVFTGIEAAFETFFRWLSMALGLVALAWPGSVFFRGAWAAIRTRTAHLDLPIAIGLGAGGLAGTVNTLLGRGEIYFDSLCVLVFLLLVGRAIQRRQQRWAADAVELLYSLTPTAAWRVEGASVRAVPIESIQPGDLVEIRAGETIPVDGQVESGQSAVDLSLLTGESVPRDVHVGEAVCAGTLNVAAALRVRAVATGEQSRVGKLMQLLERSARQGAPIVRAADRIAGYFTATMLLLAAITLALWLVRDAGQAIDNTLALLLVTCPCALGLATPLIVTVAIGRGAKRGLLIKGGETLEALARRGTIFLDKTGTLTQGRLRLIEWRGPAWARPLVKAVERHSAHPIARALVAALADEPELPATDVTQTTGSGIAGVVDGRRVDLGSARLLDRCAAADESCVAAVRAFGEAGLTPVVVVVDQRAVAVAGLGDPLRDDAVEALDRLRRDGWRVGLLSGDDPRVVQQVAARLAVPADLAFAAQSPEDKLAAVNHARASGPVVMVGDGVNDSAALAAATVGIAVRGGAEASLVAADAYVNRPGLTPIVELIEGGRRTLRLIRLSFALSLGYNALAAGLAMTGWLNPLIAAILMPISSFTVLSVALAGRTLEGPACR